MHPALCRGFGPGFKIKTGYDLVGNSYTASDVTAVPQESATPLEQRPKASGVSHGTHVTGIIGGYCHWRVDGRSKKLASDAIVKAMKMAHEAGAHIFVLVSAGYKGFRAAYIIGQPAAAPGAFTVAYRLISNC
ncbi:hypothetical protein INT47_009055 [Mucor saturninus]|uniref:Peptidase S8/S53 domain-containing protein n=1 Tax=Mucor saturninus TaxID=64648 RepID=A0A8H7VC56_9FUNG|nr:hypothetical protein INT47_009055 [Mucor saturninus]